ncbi:MAG: HdeD family acid-resistance protein [Gaiellaceae bacterium]
MDLALDTREAVEDAAGKWWLFLVGGIAWLVFALIVFQGNYKTVYVVSILFGIVAIAAGLTEFMSLGFWTSGWKIVHAILGTLFVIAGVWALVHPHNAFATLAALMGLFLLFKGIYDIMVSFIAKEQLEIWWLQLVLGILEVFLAFWVSGSFRKSVILLVAYVGIIALSRGITDIFVAFKLRGLKKDLAAGAPVLE